MRVHYLQHLSFEAPGSIEAWLRRKGHSVSSSLLYASPELPAQDSFDGLVVMGGSMSVNDEEEYPWLVQEKRLVREAMASGKALLGVCLGAQLIASALGARVYKNAVPEIGWFPIEGIPGAEPGSFRFPASLQVFHWHGETFDLPPGATRLARSLACENQAFQIGRRVIGLQFHMETTRSSAQALVDNCRDELVGGPYVQGEAEILSASAETYAAMGAELDRLLDLLFGASE
jgi:GMP synthase-like glutamine amidotransferase